MLVASLLNRVQIVLVDARARDGGKHLPYDLAEHLAGGSPEGSPFGRRVHHDETPLVVERVEGVRDAFQDRGGPVMGLAQSRLRLLAPGDVLDDPSHAPRLAGLIRAVSACRPYPAGRPVVPQDPTFKAPVAPSGERLTEVAVYRFAIFRKHVLDEHLVRPLWQKLLVTKYLVVLEGPVRRVVHQV